MKAVLKYEITPNVFYIKNNSLRKFELSLLGKHNTVSSTQAVKKYTSKTKYIPTDPSCVRVFFLEQNLCSYIFTLSPVSSLTALERIFIYIMRIRLPAQTFLESEMFLCTFLFPLFREMRNENQM